MEFKKIDIDAETFEKISEEVWKAYGDANECSFEEDLRLALSNVVFNVRKPFDEDGWNSCDVFPPSKYNMHDVLIRKKGTDSHSGGTLRVGKYRVGFYNSDPRVFFDCVGCQVFSQREDPSDFEYKIIK